jgi:hypothetical protein
MLPLDLRHPVACDLLELVRNAPPRFGGSNCPAPPLVLAESGPANGVAPASTALRLGKRSIATTRTITHGTGIDASGGEGALGLALFARGQQLAHPCGSLLDGIGRRIARILW